MKNSDWDFIKQIREARGSIPEALTLAGALAFAIAILGAGVYEILGAGLSILVGFLLASSCALYIVARNTRPKVYDADFKAAAFLDSTTAEPFPVRNYRFSEQLTSHVRSAFAEAPALRAQWEKFFAPSTKNSNFPDHEEREPGLRLVKEAAEYELLEQLAVHLTSYFSRRRGSSTAIREYSRANLPDVLLSNRMFEIFSREMADREGFESAREGDNEEVIIGNKRIHTRVVVASSSDGRYFHHFSLTLPEGSKIYRPTGEGVGALDIKGPVVEMELRVHCEGYTANTPAFFEKNYMKKNFDEVRAMDIRVSVKVTVKRRFTWRLANNTRSYGWVEPLMKELRSDFDFPFFLKEINWPNIDAMLWALGDRGNENTVS